jgi:protein-disulfide isomerase
LYFLISLVTSIVVVAAAAGINHAWPIFGTNDGDGGGGGSVVAAQGTPTVEATPKPVTIDVGDNPAKGPADAKVTIVEFSDFQCPYCGKFVQETLPQILSNYGDKVRFVFMNLPLTSIHQYAQKAAEAAECANEQGAFWQFHDIMFQNQSALTVDDLKSYAAQLQLDTAKFNDCLDTGKMADEVDADLAAGEKAVSDAGLTRFGTPAFFINGVHLGGAQPYENFKAAIDAALKAAE